MISQGSDYGLASKSTCHISWTTWAGLSEPTYNRMKEPTPKSCPLTSMWTMVHTHTNWWWWWWWRWYKFNLVKKTSQSLIIPQLAQNAKKKSRLHPSTQQTSSIIYLVPSLHSYNVQHNTHLWYKTYGCRGLDERRAGRGGRRTVVVWKTLGESNNHVSSEHRRQSSFKDFFSQP